MKKVLVVEDNILDKRLMQHLLMSNFDFEVDDVSNGEEALAFLNKINYDLVITDIIMPKIEGIELITKIKKEYPNLHVIAVSSGKPFYLYLAKKLGIQGIFTKPINKGKFLEQVSNLLSAPLLSNTTI